MLFYIVFRRKEHYYIFVCRVFIWCIISSRFEFMVMYGRRRVGKTTMLQEFAGKHKVMFYSAQEKNDILNLVDFSKIVQRHFEGQYIAPFQSWEDLFKDVN